MNLIKQILAIALLLSFLEVKAQSVEVRTSKWVDLDKRGSILKHLFSDESGHYVTSTDNVFLDESVQLEKYDQQFNAVSSKTILSIKDRCTHIDTKYINGRFVSLVKKSASKGNGIILQVVPISKEGDRGEFVTIKEIPKKLFKETPSIYWGISGDTSKLFVAAIYEDAADKNKTAVFISLMDNTLKEIWSKTTTLDIDEDKFVKKDLVLADNNDVFILSKEFNDIKPNDITPHYSYVVWQVHSNGEKATRHEVNIDNAFVKGGTIVRGDEGSIICTGIYADREPTYRNDGAFFMKINPSSGITIPSQKKPFTLANFPSSDNLRQVPNKEGGVKVEPFDAGVSYDINTSFLAEDGSLTVVAENNYSSYANQSGQKYLTYSSDQLLVLDFDKNGALNKVTKVPKLVDGGFTLYSFYCPMKVGKDIYFLYNGNIKDIEQPGELKTSYIRKREELCAVLVKLDSKRVMKHIKVPINYAETESALVPIRSTQIGNTNKIFFLSQKFKLGSMGQGPQKIGSIDVKVD